MGWRGVIVDSPCKISVGGNYLILRSDEVKKIHLSEVYYLMIACPAVNITGVALCELNRQKIKVVFCDEKRNPYGELIGYYGCFNCSKKLKTQIAWDSNVTSAVNTMIIAQKITNQALLLRKCGFDERAEMLEDYVAEIDLASNVAVLELMRPEIFNNVLLDLTAPVFPAREVAIEDGEKLLGTNDILCISDMLDLSLSGKTLLGRLYKHIDNVVFSDQEERMNLDNSISRLRQYFLGALRCLDVDLDTSPKIEVKDVCAMFGLTPFCATDDIACKLEQFTTLCAELKLCKVLVLIQAKAYMDDLSLESVYRNALRHRIGLIMAESAHRQEKLYAEKKLIVYKDFSDQIL